MIVYTDNLLTYVLSKAKFNATGRLWVAVDFYITIKYRPGREPDDNMAMANECTEEMLSRSEQATVQSLEGQGSIIIWSMSLLAQCPVSTEANLQPMPPEEILLAQREGRFTGPVIEWMMSDAKPESADKIIQYADQAVNA